MAMCLSSQNIIYLIFFYALQLIFLFIVPSPSGNPAF